MGNYSLNSNVNLKEMYTVLGSSVTTSEYLLSSEINSPQLVVREKVTAYNEDDGDEKVTKENLKLMKRFLAGGLYN